MHATRIIGAMSTKVLQKSELSRKTKMKVYNACKVPTLLYGCESWTLQARHMSRLQAVEMKYLRRVAGVTWMDRVRNEEVRERLGQEAVTDMMWRRQSRWLEKLTEMDNGRLVKRGFDDEVEGKRPRGRPRKRWVDNFQQTNACEQLSVSNLIIPKPRTLLYM